MDQRFRGDSLEELKSSRSVAGKDFPNFEMLDVRIASALNQIIQNSYFKKKVSPQEQKVQKEDRFPRGRQITFMIYDNFQLLVLMIPFLIMRIYIYIYISLFETMMFRTSIRDGTKFYCL